MFGAGSIKLFYSYARTLFLNEIKQHATSGHSKKHHNIPADIELQRNV